MKPIIRHLSLRDDPAVLALFLRQAHADTLDVMTGKYQFDDFAIMPASGALREFAALRPGLLHAQKKNIYPDGAMAYIWLALVIMRLKPGATGPVTLRARSEKLAFTEISNRHHP